VKVVVQHQQVSSCRGRLIPAPTPPIAGFEGAL
jgi:hypothetical protein